MANVGMIGYEDVYQSDQLRYVRLQLLDPGGLAAATGQDYAVVGGLPDSGGTIVGVNITVSVAPVGSTAIFDVNINGTTIYTTQANRATIAAAATESTEAAAPEAAFVTNGDLISLDCDQVGSSTAGSNAATCVVIRVDKPLDDD